MHITGVTHGSFGFILEEINPNGMQWLDTSLKIASDTVIALLENLASEDDERATIALEDVNERLFGNVRELVKLIKEHDATLKVALPDRVADLGAAPLQRAYERIANAALEDRELTILGVLEGILPGARRFEFRSLDGQPIKGKVARTISEEYLQSLQTAPLVGQRITGVFRKRTVHDYVAMHKESFTLLRIVLDEGLPSHVV